ncbi:MAG TPA: zf-HC2 domain-containing protein [Candidatus Binatia bacterium]|nr:zf-HC2 domain-containing protein [Candidatus Binatia bacterium]
MVVNCEKVWKEISNYIEGDVDTGLRAAMDDHFRTCKKCTSVLQGTRNVIQLYSDERMIEVPAGFGRRLERRLVQGARVRRRAWSSWSAWLVPVAALALIAGGLRWANSLTVAHPLRSEHAQASRNIPPDMPVVVTEGAKEFHVAGCEFIHNKDKVRTLTAKEAIREGYVPCVRCMRKYLQTASIPFTFEALEASSGGTIGVEEWVHGQ